MASKKLKVNDVYDFIQIVLTPGMVRFMLALRSGTKTSKELATLSARRNKKIIDFLGLSKKSKDANGIVSFSLTQRGIRISTALKSLYDAINDLLPDEED